VTGSAFGIVGLGLVGGSLARDLSGAGANVIGIDRDGDAVEQARAAGAIAAGGSDLAQLAHADAVILAVPPAATARLLHGLSPHVRRARWITDVASTKASVLAAAGAAGLGDRYVGSHPLAGGTGTGFGAARRGLFTDALVYLSPGAAPAEVTAAVRDFWLGLRARPLLIDAAEHDHRVAWTSQLPQFAATMLGVTLHRAGLPAGELGAGGRDTTRLAASSPELWTDIALDSGPHLLAAVQAYHMALGALLESLRAGDGAVLHDFLDEARRWHAAGSAVQP
jgi:prephenate dehydrogenase